MCIISNMETAHDDITGMAILEIPVTGVTINNVTALTATEIGFWDGPQKVIDFTFRTFGFSSQHLWPDNSNNLGPGYLPFNCSIDQWYMGLAIQLEFLDDCCGLSPLIGWHMQVLLNRVLHIPPHTYLINSLFFSDLPRQKLKENVWCLGGLPCAFLSKHTFIVFNRPL